MQQLEIGDIAVLCNPRFHPEKEGEEVTVCTPCRILPVRQSDGTIAQKLGYGVMTKDGRKFVVRPWQLRKKRRREVLGSWDQCVWRPERGAIRGG
jgi:hypothetical protein